MDWASLEEEFITYFYYDYVPTVMKEQAGVSGLIVYPNQETDINYVERENHKNRGGLITLMNAEGRIISIVNSRNPTSTIPANELNSGICFFKID